MAAGPITPPSPLWPPHQRLVDDGPHARPAQRVALARRVRLGRDRPRRRHRRQRRQGHARGLPLRDGRRQVAQRRHVAVAAREREDGGDAAEGAAVRAVEVRREARPGLRWGGRRGGGRREERQQRRGGGGRTCLVAEEVRDGRELARVRLARLQGQGEGHACPHTGAARTTPPCTSAPPPCGARAPPRRGQRGGAPSTPG